MRNNRSIGLQMGSSLREQTTPAAGEERIDFFGIPEFLRRAFFQVLSRGHCDPG